METRRCKWSLVALVACSCFAQVDGYASPCDSSGGNECGALTPVVSAADLGTLQDEESQEQSLMEVSLLQRRQPLYNSHDKGRGDATLAAAAGNTAELRHRRAELLMALLSVENELRREPNAYEGQGTAQNLSDSVQEPLKAEEKQAFRKSSLNEADVAEGHLKAEEEQEEQEDEEQEALVNTSVRTVSLQDVSRLLDPICQAQADAFCRNDCTPDCADGQEVVARYGSNMHGNMACYAASALWDMQWYKEGSKCYCSRAAELTAVRRSCEATLGARKGSTDGAINCQEQANRFCQLDGVCKLRCTSNQPIYAAHSGSMNRAQGARWRCYGASALEYDKQTWNTGKSCYCSRDKEIWAIWYGCSPPPKVDHAFYPGLLDVSCFRIPAVTQTESGVLLAFAEARHGSCGDHAVWEIAQTRSFDGGRSWEYASFAVGSKSFRVGNPAVVSTRAGRTLIMYAGHTEACAGNCAKGNGVVYSDDDGETWSQPIDISAQIGKAANALPGPGNMVELKSGRIVAALHKGYYEAVYIVYSDDQGITWTLSNARLRGMDEVTIAQYPDGAVVVNMRHLSEPRKGRGYAKSYDDGVSWSGVTYDERLVGPVCEGSLVSFGGVVYFSNPFSSGTRRDVSIQCSVDNGRTWANLRPIHRSGTAGYSALVQAELRHYGSDKRLGILYESVSGSISFATVPAWSTPHSCLLESSQVMI